MKNYIYLLLATVLISCGAKNAETNTGSLSWQEKKILEFGYTEKNLDLSMEEMMGRQKSCRDYANEYIGEENYDHDREMYHEHRYSPRFDRCFTLRTVRLPYPNDPTSNYKDLIIFDALIGEVLASSATPWCRDIYKDSEQTPEEIDETCPEDYKIQWLWEALIDT